MKVLRFLVEPGIDARRARTHPRIRPAATRAFKAGLLSGTALNGTTTRLRAKLSVRAMRSDAHDQSDAEIGPAAAHEGRRAGLIFSVALHALVLSAFVVMLGLAAIPNDISLVIPVDIVQLADKTASPVEPTVAPVPQQQAAPPSSPDPIPVDLLSARKKRLPPDELEAKLRQLAQLRQPLVDTHLAAEGRGSRTPFGDETRRRARFGGGD